MNFEQQLAGPAVFFDNLKGVVQGPFDALRLSLEKAFQGKATANVSPKTHAGSILQLPECATAFGTDKRRWLGDFT